MTKEVIQKPDEELVNVDVQKRRSDYNKAVRTAELVSIILNDCKFKIDREHAPERGQKVTINASFTGMLKGLNLNEETGDLRVNIEWGVVLKAQKKRFASCHAVYDVAYGGFKETNDDILSLFAENNARAACYPYFRALFANLDWAANLRSPPLPIAKFHPKV